MKDCRYPAPGGLLPRSAHWHHPRVVPPDPLDEDPHMGQPRTFPHTERRPRPRRLMGRDDDGQAGILLLFALTLAMLALTVLFVRVGAANDMRSQAQTAADATALSAVGALQAAAAETLAT